MALGLGSNLGSDLGSPEQIVSRAIRHLSLVLTKARHAPLYRSQAISQTPQADYVNTVVVGHSALPSEALLALAKELELDAGRRRTGERDQPRTLDVDLLLVGDETASRPELTLPHPRLSGRLFVLQPLADLAPGWIVPATGVTVETLLDRLAEDDPAQRVERLDVDLDLDLDPETSTSTDS